MVRVASLASSRSERALAPAPCASGRPDAVPPMPRAAALRNHPRCRAPPAGPGSQRPRCSPPPTAASFVGLRRLRYRVCCHRRRRFLRGCRWRRCRGRVRHRRRRRHGDQRRRKLRGTDVCRLPPPQPRRLPQRGRRRRPRRSSCVPMYEDRGREQPPLTWQSADWIARCRVSKQGQCRRCDAGEMPQAGYRRRGFCRVIDVSTQIE